MQELFNKLSTISQFFNEKRFVYEKLSGAESTSGSGRKRVKTEEPEWKDPFAKPSPDSLVDRALLDKKGPKKAPQDQLDSLVDSALQKEQGLQRGGRLDVMQRPATQSKNATTKLREDWLNPDKINAVNRESIALTLPSVVSDKTKKSDTIPKAISGQGLNLNKRTVASRGYTGAPFIAVDDFDTYKKEPILYLEIGGKGYVAQREAPGAPLKDHLGASIPSYLNDGDSIYAPNSASDRRKMKEIAKNMLATHKERMAKEREKALASARQQSKIQQDLAAESEAVSQRDKEEKAETTRLSKREPKSEEELAKVTQNKELMSSINEFARYFLVTKGVKATPGQTTMLTNALLQVPNKLLEEIPQLIGTHKLDGAFSVNPDFREAVLAFVQNHVEQYTPKKEAALYALLTRPNRKFPEAKVDRSAQQAAEGPDEKLNITKKTVVMATVVQGLKSVPGGGNLNARLKALIQPKVIKGKLSPLGQLDRRIFGAKALTWEDAVGDNPNDKQNNLDNKRATRLQQYLAKHDMVKSIDKQFSKMPVVPKPETPKEAVARIEGEMIAAIQEEMPLGKEQPKDLNAMLTRMGDKKWSAFKSRLGLLADKILSPKERPHIKRKEGESADATQRRLDGARRYAILKKLKAIGKYEMFNNRVKSWLRVDDTSDPVYGLKSKSGRLENMS